MLKAHVRKSVGSIPQTAFYFQAFEVFVSSGRCRERFYLKKKVLPGFEPGLQGSEPWVLTNYTIELVQSQEASVAEQVLVNFVGVSSILTVCIFLKGEF